MINIGHFKVINLFQPFFILFILFNFCVCKEFDVSKITYQIQQERLLGLDLKISLFEIEVTEDIYIFEGFECRPGCKELPYDCGFCDYSTNLDCSEKELTNSQKMKNCSCEQIEKVCTLPQEDESDWITLKEGRQGPFTIEQSKQQLFRFFFDKPCHGFKIKAIEIYGYVLFTMNTVPFSGVEGVPALGSLQYEVAICPLDFFNKFGTYEVIAVGDPSQNVKFDLVLEFKDFGEEEVETITPKKCENDQYGSYCMEIGKPVGVLHLKVFNFMYLRWTITSCQSFILSIETVWGQYDLHASTAFLFGFDKTSLLPTEFLVSANYQLVFGMCPQDGKEFSYFYIVAANLQYDMDFVINLTPYFEKERTKISELQTPWQAWKLIQGSFDIQCQKKTFPCRKGSLFLRNTCMEGYNSVPTKGATGLWPRPRYLISLDPDTFTNVPYESEDVLEDKKLIGGLFLETMFGSTKNTILSNWETNISNCTINFHPYSVILSEQGMPIVGTYSIQEKERECDLQSFEEISKQMDSLVLSMNSQNDSTSILAVRYIIDSLTFSETWQSCDAQIRTFLEKSVEPIDYYNTQACTYSMINDAEISETDPCCNLDLGWTMCCERRNISDQLEVFKVRSDLGDNKMCGDTKCMSSFLEEYGLYSKLRDSVSGCSTAIGESLTSKQFNSLDFYRECKTKVFGEYDGEGKVCVQDSDCLFQCHSTKKICVYQNDEQLKNSTTQFFECLDENMTSLMREFFINKYELGFEISLSEFMKREYKITDCVTWIGRSLLSEKNHHTQQYKNACLDCEHWCFDSSCIVPLRCEKDIPYGRVDAFCGYTDEFYISSQSKCTSPHICNWDHSIQSEQQCLSNNNNGNDNDNETQIDTDSYCGACETPSECILIKKDEGDCSGDVCVFGDEVFVGLSKEECSQKGRCSLDCPNCGSKSGCIQSGICSDTQLVGYMNEVSQLLVYQDVKFIPPTDGYCVKELKAWNDPDCSESRYTTADYPLDNACLLVTTKDECLKNKKYTWKQYSKTKEECESEYSCDDPNIFTSIKSLKNTTECEKCGGKSESTWKWSNGVWYEGEMRKVQSIQKQWMNEHKWDTTIDFMRLSKDIVESNTEQYSLELQTEAQCRLNPLKAVMKKMICLCEHEGDEDVEEICFGSDENLVIGVGKVCASQKSSFIAPPSVLYFDTDSVNGTCINIQIIRLLASEIQSPSTQSISISFRKKREERDNVKNDKGVIVGDILGDGASILINNNNGNDGNDGSSLLKFTLCISVESLKPYSSSSFDVLDFGIKISDNEVRPTSSTIYFSDAKTICSLISSKTFSKLEFFPITRVEDWEGEDTSKLSQGEKGVFGLMFSLYLIVLLVKAVHEIREGKNLKSPKRWIVFCLMVCLLVRVIYFGELLSGELSETSDGLSEFLLIETPTYFYFLALVLAAILWYSLSSISDKSSIHIKVGKIWSVCIFITIIFVLILVLIWEYLHNNQGSYYCDQRVYQEPDNSDKEAIRLVYRIVFSLSSILVCVVMVYYGSTIRSTLRKSQLKAPSAENAYFSNKIYFVNLISTISLVSQCIFFILYSELAEPSYQWLLILIIIELFPMSSIFFVLSSESSSSSSSSSSTSKKNTSSSADTPKKNNSNNNNVTSSSSNSIDNKASR